MEITPTSTTPQGTATEKTASADRAKLTGDLQSFLTLLTTQLKHQDPLEPMDSTEFTAQLAQFASVEQSIQTNANLEKLIGLNTSNQALTAVGYLGNYVEAKGNTGNLIDGVANFAYELPSNADAVAVTIRNEAGIPVSVTPGEIKAGRHNFAWDGTNAQGVPQPEGKYTIAVNAVTADGGSVKVQTYTVGIADGADSSGDTIKIFINGVAVPLSDVVAVKKAPPTT
jgi:flagellar basal-body rod modification protein FlgD